MPTPLEDYVRQVLSKSERNTKIRNAIYSAWSTVCSKYPQRSWFRRKTTVRGLMWEHAVDNLVEAIGGDPGVFVLRHHDTVSFILDDAVLLRVKKADMELKTSNYPTPLAGLFHDHESDLFDHDGLQRVEAAYVLNQFETKLDWVGVVAWAEDRQLWHFELEDAPSVAPVLHLPQPAKRPTAQLVKPKKIDIGKKEIKKDDHGEE